MILAFARTLFLGADGGRIRVVIALDHGAMFVLMTGDVFRLRLAMRGGMLAMSRCLGRGHALKRVGNLDRCDGEDDDDDASGDHG